MTQKIIDHILSFQWSVLALIVFYVIYKIALTILNRRYKGNSDSTLARSIIVSGIFLIGTVVVILTLPMKGTMRSEVANLLGIVISAVLALSSATFFGNGLGGIMLRIINNFKPGDFIQVNEYFGRITQRGLFHTELQTENRDLTTIPNLYLVTNPVKVTRSSGTFISAAVSLGYDVNRQKIEKALLKAADHAELTDPFVRITALGDYSVVYVVYGMVEEIKTFLTARSRLHGMILDALHEAGIEIVSPTFMNQRQVGDTVFIPKKVRKKEEVIPAAEAPESLIFDKAEEAESIEKRKERLSELNQKIKDFNAELNSTEESAARETLQKNINRLTDVKEKMIQKIDDQLDEMKSKD